LDNDQDQFDDLEEEMAINLMWDPKKLYEYKLRLLEYKLKLYETKNRDIEKDTGKNTPTAPHTHDKNLLTANDVKNILKCSKSHVYNLAKSGKLKSIRMPGPGGKDLVRFRLKDLEHFLEHYKKN